MTVRAYPAYRESGSSWFDRLPSEWKCLPFKAVVSRLQSGTSVNSDDRPVEGGELGVLKTSCVYTGVFDARENKAIVPAEYSRASCPIRVNHLIVSRMNTPDLIGAAGLVTEPADNLYLPDRLWQIGLNGAVPKFTYYWMRSAAYRSQVQAACSGTSSSMQNLSQPQLLSFHFPCPSVIEQSAVVAFLDRETGKIDALVAEQERLIALLKEKRQAVISQAVTKGLNPDVPMKESGVEWLGEVPAHWHIRQLKHSIADGSSISYGIVQPGEPQLEGVPFIQTTNMTTGRFDVEDLQKTSRDIESNYPRSRLVGGEVILGIRASVGAAYVVPDYLTGVNLSRGVARIVPKSDLASTYLKWFLAGQHAADYWAAYKQGSTFSEVSIETVREMSLPIPPMPEQAEIVGSIAKSIDAIDGLVGQSERAITLLSERRSALISAAVTGKIDVRDHAAVSEAA